MRRGVGGMSLDTGGSPPHAMPNDIRIRIADRIAIDSS
jgi:hypothetical protein